MMRPSRDILQYRGLMPVLGVYTKLQCNENDVVREYLNAVMVIWDMRLTVVSGDIYPRIALDAERDNAVRRGRIDIDDNKHSLSPAARADMFRSCSPRSHVFPTVIT